MTEAIKQYANDVQHGVRNNKERLFYILIIATVFLIATYGILVGQATFAAASVDKLGKEVKTISSDVQITQASVLSLRNSITRDMAGSRGLVDPQNTEFITKSTSGRVAAASYEF